MLAYNEGRVCPLVSSGAAEDSTSLRSDWRKLGPFPWTTAFEASVRCALEGPATTLCLASASVEASEEFSIGSKVRLVLGLLSGRSGCGAGSASDGDDVADFRRFLVGAGSS